MSFPIFSLLLIAVGVVTCSDLNYIFSDTRLPPAFLRPTLANGNLGFIAYGDTVYMNGIFNGAGPSSHRAKIPNYANIQLKACEDSFLNPTGCNYQLDMQKGMFRTIYNDPRSDYYVVHDMYPSRALYKTIVNRIRIQRLNSQSEIQVSIQRFTSGSSVDFNFGSVNRREIRGVMYSYFCGRTTQVEDVRYQSTGHNVCVTYPDLPSEVTLGTDKTAEEYSFFTAFTNTELEGVQDISSAGQEKEVHEVRMLEMWEKYGITVGGNEELDRALKASAFYLSSSLPHTSNVQGSYPFYGISPSGLGYGGDEFSYYKGHSLWESEMWMFPTILLVDPENARNILYYRSYVKEAATDRATNNLFEGWQFPWESAFTGVEVTPEERVNSSVYQHHVTADIAYAARMYFYATRSVSWMESVGCRLAYETARFWKSRVAYNKETDLYEILQVGGPDESSYGVKNNAFTNVIAAHNLLFGDFAGCLCRQTVGSSAAERRKMVEAGLGMTLPYDEDARITPQHFGYRNGTAINQADTILLGYPLEYPLFKSTRALNLETYEEVTREDAPPMTWAMHAINHLDLDQYDEATEMFKLSYQRHIQPPYNVWTDGVENTISGTGALLQAIINGYAGVRLRNDMLTVTKPRVPPGTSRLVIPQINYMASKFSLHITSVETTVEFTMGNVPVSVIADGIIQDACASCTYSFRNQLVLQPANPDDLKGCTLQETIIGIKLADQDNGAALTTVTGLLLLVLSTIVTLMLQRI